MSKLKKPILLAFLIGSCHFVFPIAAAAQYLEASISIDTDSRVALVTGTWGAEQTSRRNLSFLPSAIGAAELGSRIADVVVKGRSGQAVSLKKFNSAEYVLEADFSSFSYRVDLRPGSDPRSSGHTSWIGKDEGVLFLDDLLPLSTKSGSKRAIVSIQIPSEWQLIGTEEIGPNEKYDVADVERSVFVLGKSARQTKAPGEINAPILTFSGRWHFTDAEAVTMTASIYQNYVEVFGGTPGSRPLIAVLPFPQENVRKGAWEAETRGSTVLIVSSDMDFRTQSLQRLHEQLRHEMFHLWLPNGVNLTGRYDWFYEGFALYQSLKTGVTLNQIRFEDLLDTLSRAHNIDRSQIRPLSLIEASNERWSGADTQVYARGMIVAFLCDLSLLQNSKGKISIDSIFKKIYASNKFPAAPAEGNAAILKVLESDRGLAEIANSYVRGSKPIEWSVIVGGAGLENEAGTSRTSLRVKSKLTGREKASLDKLGYNNWRKLARK